MGNVTDLYDQYLRAHLTDQHRGNVPVCRCFDAGFSGGVSVGTSGVEQKALKTNDTLSDAAFLDECAMRAMAALITSEPEIAEEQVATAAHGYGSAMLAVRKRRREGGK